MATYSNTGEIQRQAPGVKKAGRKRVKGHKKVQNYLTGTDAYGRQLKGAHKTISTVGALATSGFAYVGSASRARGKVTGAKQVKIAQKHGLNTLKNAAEIALTVATYGGYAGISAGAKGVSAGAKAAAVAAKATKGFGASVKAASGAYKTAAAAAKASSLAASAASKGATVAAKSTSALGSAGQTTTSKLAEQSGKAVGKGTQAAHWNMGTGAKYAAEKTGTVTSSATSALGASSKIPTQGAQNVGNFIQKGVGGEQGKLLGDFVKQFSTKGDQRAGAFAKEFYLKNKDKINKQGAEWAKKQLNEGWKKYEEENPDVSESHDFSNTVTKDNYADSYDKYMENQNLKKGGKLEGKSHAQGGEKAVIGDNHIELEGDERVFSKKDTKKMDGLAESGNYSALGKMYAKAKGKHDKSDNKSYGGAGLKTDDGEMDMAKAVELAEAAGAKWPIVSAAQWKLESNSGKSNIAKDTNNYFGIKYDEGAAEKLRAAGIEVNKSEKSYYDKAEGKSWFYMSFPNESDSFAAHEQFLLTNKRYRENGYFDAENPHEAMVALKKAGYATDALYVEKLENHIKTDKSINGGESLLYDVNADGLNYEDADKQAKYEDWKSGNKYSIPALQDLNETVKEYNKGRKDAQMATNKTSRGLHILKTELDVLKKDWEEDGKLTPGYDNLADMAVAIASKEKEVLLKQFELIDTEAVTANKINDDIIPKIEAAEAKLKDEYDLGNIGKSEFDLAWKKITDYKTNVDSYVKRAERQVAYKEEHGESLLANADYLVNNTQKNKDDGIINPKLQPTSSTDAYVNDEGKLVNVGDSNYDYAVPPPTPEQQEAINIANKERDLINKEKEEFSKFEYEDLEAELNLSVGLNYTDAQSAQFEKDKKAYTSKKIKEAKKLSIDKIADAETDMDIEHNLPITVSDEEINAYLGRREVKEEATGLKGIYEKYGGMDSVLQMTGMAAAYKSATEPLPQARKSDQWQNHMATMKDRAQLGLDEATKTLYQRNAERTYAYDVANIGKMATSGQSALGALGAAGSRKYQADLQMAGADAQAREKHTGEYQAALASDENMTQAMWKMNEYDESSRKRELKSGLIGQQVKNLREAKLYSDEFGTGSFAQRNQEASLAAKEANNRAFAYSAILATKQGEEITKPPLITDDTDENEEENE